MRHWTCTALATADIFYRHIISMQETKPMFFFSIILAVISSMLYHVFIKLTPSDVNPALSLIMTYITAAILCLGLLLLFPLEGNAIDALRQLNWASWALALAIVGLEMGFLLAYRAGWQISTVAVVVNATMMVLLVPIGVRLFREELSRLDMLGILVCIIGLVMVNTNK